MKSFTEAAPGLTPGEPFTLTGHWLRPGEIACVLCRKPFRPEAGPIARVSIADDRDRAKEYEIGLACPDCVRDGLARGTT